MADPSVGLNVYQLPGTNALDVGDAIRAKMKELKKRFPEGIDYAIAYDTTPFIRESISEVFSHLARCRLPGRHRRSLLPAGLAGDDPAHDRRARLPDRHLRGHGGMGYSLNNISLFGLVLAIGIVVDDAIVVLENIERQMAKGSTRAPPPSRRWKKSAARSSPSPWSCARSSCRAPSSAASPAASFAVRHHHRRLDGDFRHQRPDDDAIARHRDFQAKAGANGHVHKPEALPWWIFGLLGLVSLSLITCYDLAEPFGFPSMTPDEDDDDAEVTGGLAAMGAHGALFLARPVVRPGVWLVQHQTDQRGPRRPLPRLQSGVRRADERLWLDDRLRFALSAIVLLAYCGLVFLTYVTFRDSPRGFVPQQDMGRIIVSLQLPDSATLDRTQEQMAQADKIIRSIPGVAHSIGLSGISFVESANGSNFGSFFIILDPFEKRRDRKLRDDSIMAQMRRTLHRRRWGGCIVVGAIVPCPGVSTSGGFKVMVQDRGGLGLSSLQDQTDKFIRKVKQQIGTDALKNKQKSPPTRAARNPSAHAVHHQYPVPLQHAATLHENRPCEGGFPGRFPRRRQSGSGNLSRVGQREYFNDFGRCWQVTVQADIEFRSRWTTSICCKCATRGRWCRWHARQGARGVGPIFVRRYNLFTAAPITGALPGVSSGEVINAVDRYFPRGVAPLDEDRVDGADVHADPRGDTTGIVFALAVVCVFLALAALYESWTLPLAVILVVPLCVLSSLIGVLASGSSVNIFVQIGLVVLVGLACKNAILVVEFAKELHSQQKSVFEATLEASRLRLRPIFMTSFAFILGVLPLCVASGAGAEMVSLGIAVFSGMLGVTAFGIFVTPVFFYVIQGIGQTSLFCRRPVNGSVRLCSDRRRGSGGLLVLASASCR